MKNYIQIGTNHGNDDFYYIIKNLTEKSKVILIEPQKDCMVSIENCYRELSNFHEIIVLNKGIVVNKSHNKLFIYSDSGDGALSSVINRKSYKEIIGEIYFETITMKELFEGYDLKEIELLYIDTEGYDYEILNSINLEKTQIRKIICEKWDYDEDNTEEINTGPSFFKKLMKEKLTEYTLELYQINNYVFTKKNDI